MEIAISMPEFESIHATKIGNAVPGPLSAHAVIDTGSNVCCIDTGLVKKLGCIPHGAFPVIAGEGGEKDRLAYILTFKFLQLDVPQSPPMQFFGLDIGARGAHCLIGRRVLEYFGLYFRVDGTTGEFEIGTVMDPK